jgi:hydroxymethylglutaryl-CoA synthase
LAAALDSAAARGLAWEERDLLAVGYGSGDAAEALRLRVRPQWSAAAAKIDVAAALCDSRACDLQREDYEALHDGDSPATWRGRGASAFVIESIGSGVSGGWEDTGIERYRFAGATN